MKSLLKQLLPPVSYALDAPHLDAELQAEANRFTLIQDSANLVRNGITPFSLITCCPIGNGSWM